MKKLIIALLIFSFLPLRAGVTSNNANDLIGTWRIFDASNNELAAIEVTLAITRSGLSRFSYRDLGAEASADDQLKGFIINQNQVVFDLITVAQSRTYAFEIDFTLGGGPGMAITNQLASCSTIGADASQVKKKFEKRLASSSQLCDEATEATTITNLKLVKDGSAAASFSTTAAIPSDITANLTTVASQIEGAWALNNRGQRKRKFLVKDTETNFLGYQFKYRLIGLKTKLGKLSEEDFITDERTGLILGDYLIINTSDFNKQNRLWFIELGSKKKKGTGYFLLTPNGDCFPSKSGSASTRVCTPNYDTSVVETITKASTRAAARRINTKTKISF